MATPHREALVIEIVPLLGIGEVEQGADLASILAAPLREAEARDGDILVITSKILSKSEGRYESLRGVIPSASAIDMAGVTGKDARLVQLVLQQSSRVVRAARNVLITRHKLGLVMANAGIDASNIGSTDPDAVLLLPEDPDQSARRLHEGLQGTLGLELGIVVSDSFGRPWRYGVVNVAIGTAGVPALIDRRGESDRDGRLMQVTQVAYADLLASAAGLAMGEAAEGIPAVLVRGSSHAGDIAAGALVRPEQEDLFQ